MEAKNVLIVTTTIPTHPFRNMQIVIQEVLLTRTQDFILQAGPGQTAGPGWSVCYIPTPVLTVNWVGLGWM